MNEPSLKIINPPKEQKPDLTQPQTPGELRIWQPVIELIRLQHQRGLSDADFARSVKLAYSGSVWGKIKSGKFNGRVPRAVWAVQEALKYINEGHVLEAAGDIVVFDHVADAEAACLLAKHSEDEHRIVMIAGASGSGKSQTLKFLNGKYGGDMLHAHPSWAASYMSCVSEFAAGIGLSDEFRSVRKAEHAIVRDLAERPRLICVDEANYFNRDGLNLLKTIANETRSYLAIATLPDDLRRLNATHNHETRQVIRRVISIISLPMIDSEMVLSIQARLFPKIVLGSFAPQIVALANKYHRLDTVVRIFNETDMENPNDILYAIERVERAIKVEGIK